MLNTIAVLKGSLECLAQRSDENNRGCNLISIFFMGDSLSQLGQGCLAVRLPAFWYNLRVLVW